MQLNVKKAIHEQRLELAQRLSGPLGSLALECSGIWHQREALNAILTTGFDKIPYAFCLYVLDTNGHQISDNIGRDGLMPGHFGRDRSQRPYMREAVPAWGFLLSTAYLSQRANRPSLTALQVVRDADKALGFIGADFDLRDLPSTADLYEETDDWRQVRGDPAIRGALFQQCRIESIMDRNMDSILAVLVELITERGMFQGVIHFSSSQAIIWLIDDPLRYRILDHEDLSDPDVCLLYHCRHYPNNALIPKERIEKIFQGLRDLRNADETLYLRQASINIYNGMISLTFSCDGTHYMSWHEFLDKDLSFWTGIQNL